MKQLLELRNWLTARIVALDRKGYEADAMVLVGVRSKIQAMIDSYFLEVTPILARKITNVMIGETLAEREAFAHIEDVQGGVND